MKLGGANDLRFRVATSWDSGYGLFLAPDLAPLLARFSEKHKDIFRKLFFRQHGNRAAISQRLGDKFRPYQDFDP